MTTTQENFGLDFGHAEYFQSLKPSGLSCFPRQGVFPEEQRAAVGKPKPLVPTSSLLCRRISRLVVPCLSLRTEHEFFEYWRPRWKDFRRMIHALGATLREERQRGEIPGAPFEEQSTDVDLVGMIDLNIFGEDGVEECRFAVATNGRAQRRLKRLHALPKLVDDAVLSMDSDCAKEFNSAQDTFTLAMLCLMSTSSPVTQELQTALLGLLRQGAVESYRWISEGLALRTKSQSDDIEDASDFMSALAEEDLAESERLISVAESELKAG